MNTRDDKDDKDISSQKPCNNTQKSMHDSGKPSFFQQGRGYAPPKKTTTTVGKSEFDPYPRSGSTHIIHGMEFFETSDLPKGKKPVKVTDNEKLNPPSKRRRCLIS